MENGYNVLMQLDMFDKSTLIYNDCGVLLEEYKKIKVLGSKDKYPYFEIKYGTNHNNMFIAECDFDSSTCGCGSPLGNRSTEFKSESQAIYVAVKTRYKNYENECTPKLKKIVLNYLQELEDNFKPQLLYIENKEIRVRINGVWEVLPVSAHNNDYKYINIFLDRIGAKQKIKKIINKSLDDIYEEF